MKSFKHSFIVGIIKACNVALVTLGLAIGWIIYYGDEFALSLMRWENWILAFIFGTIYFVFGRTYDAFKVSIYSIPEMFLGQSLSLLCSDLLVYLMMTMLERNWALPYPILISLGIQLVLSLAWCFCSNKLYYKLFKPKKTILLYDKSEVFERSIHDGRFDKKFNVEAVCSIHEIICDLSRLDEYDTVFVNGVHSHERNIILKYCISKGIEMYVIPRIGDVIMSGAEKVNMFHFPLMRVQRYSPTVPYLVLKRIFDIVVSIAGIVILSPVLLITALAIKLSDGGPVFYKQVRLTKNGKEFMIHKFRSMRIDAEGDGVARLSTGANDDRITPVGRIIRKVRIDELPQLFDILTGNLSVVGPRPERPEIAKQYEETLPEFKLRLQAKAGLTGYAQVYGKYNTTPYDKLQMDLMYISNPSILMDMKLCFATVKILFLPDSTEGIEEGAVTAMSKEEAVSEEEVKL